MNYEQFNISGEDYDGCTATEMFSLAFELGNICTMLNSGIKEDIVFSSINKNNIIRYCKFKGIPYEIRDHDDFPTLVLL